MLTHLLVCSSLFGLSLAEDPAPKAPASVPPLVSHDALQKRLGEPKLRLLDVRPRADYDKGHVPGAIWVDVKQASSLASKPGGLKDPQSWAGWIEPLGIDDDEEILVYGSASPVDTARVWWLLRYLGVPRVGIIDGGFPLWASKGRPVVTEEAKAKPRPFPIHLAADRVAHREDVLAMLKAGSAQVVDARTTEEYTGAKKSSKRGGHIPAACSVDWSNLVDKDGRFLDEAALRAKFAAAGVKPGSPVISHCQGGGRASVDAFVLERLGFPTRNYYLGWSDWGNVDDTPVLEGEAAGKP